MAIDTSKLSALDIAESENILADVFTESNVECGVGTVVRELVIRPMAILRTAAQAEQNEFFEKLDLYKVADGGAADNDTIDAVASTYRVKRLEGKAASGTIILTLVTDEKTFISKDVYFSTGEVNLYLKKTYVVIPSSDNYTYSDTPEVEYIKPVRFNNSLYATLPVDTDAGMVDTIPAGTPLTYSGTLANISDYKVLSPITGGASAESNQELAKRILYGAVKGYLSTPLQAKAAFYEDFRIDPSNVAVFGMRDSIVSRSRNPITGISQSGFIDMYLNTSNSLSTGVVSLNAYRKTGNMFEVSVPDQYAAGLYLINRVTPYDNIDVFNLKTAFGVRSTTHRLTGSTARFSAFQTVTISFELPATYTNNEVAINIEYLYMREIAALQDYVDNNDVRSVGLDTIIKGAIPCLLDLTLHLEARSANVDVQEVKQAILKKIHSLPIGTKSFTAEDIINALKEFPVSIRFPITIAGTVIMPHKTVMSASSNASFYLPESDENYDSRAVSFFSDMDRINITISLV